MLKKNFDQLPCGAKKSNIFGFDFAIFSVCFSPFCYKSFTFFAERHRNQLKFIFWSHFEDKYHCFCPAGKPDSAAGENFEKSAENLCFSKEKSEEFSAAEGGRKFFCLSLGDSSSFFLKTWTKNLPCL